MKFFKKRFQIFTYFLVALLMVFASSQIVQAATQGLWPNSTSPSDIVVANSGGNETGQFIAQASDGDYIITYALTGRAYAQKFSATDGSALATWNGGFPAIAGNVIPSAIVADAGGGAYIAMNVNLGGGNCDVLVQRMDATGTPQFGVGGINVTTGSGCEAYMDMLPDGTGGFYIVWGNGGYMAPKLIGSRFRVKKNRC